MNPSLLVCLALISASNTEPPLAAVKTSEIHVRDPFVLPVKAEGQYYIYGTMGPGRGFYSYRSKDLENWEGPLTVFKAAKDFWATHNYWAPEVHFYKDRYYMFASFKAHGVMRGTQILVADKPEGPFAPLTEKPVTPSDWECLDGTLYVDPDGTPWIVFCHEWVQVGDGEICAMKLTPDLKSAAGKPVLLFKAHDAKWVDSFEKGKGSYVTDGPFLWRTKSGDLLMLWSSFHKGDYATGVAKSKSGKIDGPWVLEEEPLGVKDAGHSMIFRTFDGKLMLSLHQPNKANRERPAFLPLKETDGRMELAVE